MEKLHQKLISANYALLTCKYFVPQRIRKIIYRSLFESHLNFGSILYGSCEPRLLINIANIQKRAVRSLDRAKYASHTNLIFKNNNLLKVSDLINLNQCLLLHKFRAKRLPQTFSTFFVPMSSDTQHISDSDYNYHHNQINQTHLCYFPHYQAVKSWNCTPINIKCEGEEEQFKYAFIKYKLSNYETECFKRNCYSCRNI